MNASKRFMIKFVYKYFSFSVKFPLPQEHIFIFLLWKCCKGVISFLMEFYNATTKKNDIIYKNLIKRFEILIDSVKYINEAA